jgi:hypothetical protein
MHQGRRKIPSRIDHLLSLSNVVKLTLHASFLQKTSKIRRDRLSSSFLSLDTLTLIMDIGHIELEYEDYDDFSSDYNSDYDFSSDYNSDYDSSPEPELLVVGKAIFKPNHSVLRVLNPRRLIIQADDHLLLVGHAFASFFIYNDTAKVISSWSRLVLVQLKDALLHTTKDDSPNSRKHRLVPRLRPDYGLPPVVVQVHLPSQICDHLPILAGVYGTEAKLTLTSYFDKTTCSTKSISTLSLCYPTEDARVLLEEGKEQAGRWLAYLRICSIEEALASARTLLTDAAAEREDEEED